VNPPRVAVGSNAHKITVYNLSSRQKQTINAHDHNIPSISYSPCGKFIASTSIDKLLKVWEEGEDGTHRMSRICLPSSEWGWAVQWLDKTKCEIHLNL